jgi:hypothetical protein
MRKQNGGAAASAVIDSVYRDGLLTMRS